ncbi:LacI family transcriptional regulator [Selenomonas sp. WCA-380-WT-3B 3/]|uniref:LacI family transcriptional regulator n=1 Tax=Selenomonas montiformis TaxID=2652285 RepID=A0A6I2UTS2_9FIRM|nr:LacI family DNA-binding transcriptional regulator [Selenomonas montiformis]MSV25563.1 LacI family transcriptional regulator [Selenomonas montiformis]
MEDRKKATIVDVARQAGVSVATVSRVVNGNYPVKLETKERVQKVIQALRYVPNVQARELNTRQSSTLGVVVPGLHNMFFAEVIDGIEEAVRQDGFSLLLNCAKNDPQQEMSGIQALVSRNVSGIILISPNMAGIRESFYAELARRIPLVFINGYHHIPDVSYVTNDEQRGTQQALDYLERLGHQRILFVRGDHSDSYTIKEEVYRRDRERHGGLDSRFLINIGEGNGPETADSAMQQLLRVIPDLDPTAIFCCNDLMAVGAINACKRLGRRVPADISVVGYDNIALSRMIEPKLTTMDQNMFQLGSNAASLLIERIRGGCSKRIVLENVLVERESAGKVRSS